MFEIPWKPLINIVSTKIRRFATHDRFISFLVNIFQQLPDVRVNADIQAHEILDRSLSLKHRGKRWDIVLQIGDHTQIFLEVKTHRLKPQKRYSPSSLKKDKGS